MNFTEFYNKNLMYNFYLDNIGLIPTLISLIFITLIFIIFLFLTIWLKDDGSKIKFLIKTSLIMILIYLIGNALFFNNNGLNYLSVNGEDF